MPSVIFVCTANVCRSPIAEALFRQQLGSQAAGWRIESAGTWASEGQPASTRGVQVLQSRGLDHSLHRSRRVTGAMLAGFNLILVMEANHKEALQVEFPELAGRIHLLSEMAGRSHDVRDPFGGSLRDYEDTVDELEQLLRLGAGKICELAKK